MLGLPNTMAASDEDGSLVSAGVFRAEDTNDTSLASADSRRASIARNIDLEQEYPTPDTPLGNARRNVDTEEMNTDRYPEAPVAAEEFPFAGRAHELSCVHTGEEMSSFLWDFPEAPAESIPDAQCESRQPFAASDSPTNGCEAGISSTYEEANSALNARGEDAYASGTHVSENVMGDGIPINSQPYAEQESVNTSHLPESPINLGSELRSAVLSDCDPTMSVAAADPFVSKSENRDVVLFGTTPLTPAEIIALENLADLNYSHSSKVDPLPSLVKRLFATVRFQREEISKVKRDEVDLANVAVEEERRRNSALQRRRSFAIDRLGERARTLQQELNEIREEHAQCGSNASQQLEYAQRLEHELEKVDQTMAKFLELGQRAGASLKKDSSPDDILAAVSSLLLAEHRVSATAKAPSSPLATTGHDGVGAQQQQLTLDDYGTRLLELERVLKTSEERCDVLLQEKTDLQVELLGLKASQSVPLTPGTPAAESTMDSCPEISDRDELAKSREENLLLRAKVDKLDDECRRLKVERESVDKEVIDLKVGFDSVSSKLASTQAERASAMKEHRKLVEHYSSLNTRHQQMSEEFTETTVAAARDLADCEAQCKELHDKVSLQERELAAREEASNQLFSTIRELESELLKYSTMLASKAKQGTVIESFVPLATIQSSADETGRGIGQHENSPATPESPTISAIQGEATAVVAMRKDFAQLTDTISSLRKECEHWKLEADRLREEVRLAALVAESGDQMGSIGHPEADKQVAFFRRLSACIARPGVESSRELVEKLVQRVENLVAERQVMEESAARLQSQVVGRERSMHLMRSEFMAEVAALKAELAHVENDRARAVSDREAAEVRFLEAAKRDDGLESRADEGTEHSICSMVDSCRYTANSNDEEMRWDDPSINAAVDSLNVLIGRKDSLVARNKALIEKLNELIHGISGHHSGSPSTKAVVIESRSLQEELVSIVALQQKVIRKLRSTTGACSPARQCSSDGAPMTGDRETTNSSALFGDQRTSEAAKENIAGKYSSPVDRRQSVSQQCTDFLRDQLADMRELCNRRAKSNAVLHGVVREMETEVERVSSLKDSAEQKMRHVQTENEKWVSRLSVVANVPATKESVEGFVANAVASMSLNEATRMQDELRLATTENRLGNALAQKRVLTHIIFTYQDKYKLDVLATATTLVRGQPMVLRLRRVAWAVIAALRLHRLGRNQKDRSASLQLPPFNIDKIFSLPAKVSLTSHPPSQIVLESAVLALQAVPKLEQALRSRAEEVQRLRASIAALDIARPEPLAELGHNEDPNGNLFDYKEDFFERKNDLARRLRKALKQREELSVRYVREKQDRQELEARIVKYVDKLSSYRRRLGRMKNETEARDRTYRAAIRFLKAKSDNALQGDSLSFEGPELDALIHGSAGERLPFGVVRDPNEEKVQTHPTSLKKSPPEKAMVHSEGSQVRR